MLDELDEIEVYGSEAQSGTQLATYSFEVRGYIHTTLTHMPCVTSLYCVLQWLCVVCVAGV